MRISNEPIKFSGTEAPKDMGVSFSSDAIYLGHIADYSIQLIFTGTPNGTLSLECSNDRGNEDKKLGGWDDSGVSHWSTVPNSSQSVTTAGTQLWNFTDCGYRWVRLVWVKSSGSGSLTFARFNGKGV